MGTLDAATEGPGAASTQSVAGARSRAAGHDNDRGAPLERNGSRGARPDHQLRTLQEHVLPAGARHHARSLQAAPRAASGRRRPAARAVRFGFLFLSSVSKFLFLDSCQGTAPAVPTRPLLTSLLAARDHISGRVPLGRAEISARHPDGRSLLSHLSLALTEHIRSAISVDAAVGIFARAYD